MSVMAVELGASRLLAPYFSSSQIVWTIIIGTIMIAMALGNIYGGRSRNPVSPRPPESGPMPLHKPRLSVYTISDPFSTKKFIKFSIYQHRWQHVTIPERLHAPLHHQNLIPRTDLFRHQLIDFF